MNYYVPIQTGDETCEGHTSSYTSSTSSHTPYILRRRFALTPTAYKYLDIGISVGLMSYVKIVIGDNRGNRIILPHTTWKTFIERRANVERLVQSTVSSSLTIQDLIVELVKIGNEYNVKISLNGTYLYMKPKTMLFMFELEHCVEHVYFELCQYTHGISEKFKYFITFLRQNCIMDKLEAVNTLRTVYDKNSGIECELILYASDNIVYHALHK